MRRVSVGRFDSQFCFFASNRFQAICKAESLILEYRKNRDEFLRWRPKKERT